MSSPPGLAAARNLLAISCCFTFIIPTTVVIIWLNVSSAVHYSRSAPQGWHTVLLLWCCIIFSVIVVVLVVLCCVLCVMTGLNYVLGFMEWRRLHPAVTVSLLAPPIEAVAPVGGRCRPASAGKLPPSCLVGLSVPHDSVLPVHGRFSSQPLYSRWERDDAGCSGDCLPPASQTPRRQLRRPHALRANIQTL